MRHLHGCGGGFSGADRCSLCRMGRNLRARSVASCRQARVGWRGPHVGFTWSSCLALFCHRRCWLKEGGRCHSTALDTMSRRVGRWCLFFPREGSWSRRSRSHSLVFRRYLCLDGGGRRWVHVACLQQSVIQRVVHLQRAAGSSIRL